MAGRFRSLAVFLLLAAAVFLGSNAVAGAQAPADTGGRAVPRTADGHPDLQGTWTNATLTPLERPKHLADRAFLSEQEATALEAQAAGRQAAADEPGARAQALARGDVGSYNQFWFDSGTTILPTRQTSLVVDPPDGRVPVRPEADQPVVRQPSTMQPGLGDRVRPAPAVQPVAPRPPDEHVVPGPTNEGVRPGPPDQGDRAPGEPGGVQPVGPRGPGQVGPLNPVQEVGPEPGQRVVAQPEPGRTGLNN